jgi:hypothetical protein
MRLHRFLPEPVCLEAGLVLQIIQICVDRARLLCDDSHQGWLGVMEPQPECLEV